MKNLIYVFISMILYTSCQESGNAQEPLLDTTIAETKLNVPYGQDTAQRMDIYLPAGRSSGSTRSIVLIHGGGWAYGRKSDFATYIDTLKKRLPHYAIFNLEYRLASEKAKFPSQEQDVKAALDFITQHSDKYGIDSNELVLLGASAGAHLAMLQAYKYQSPRIKAVIDFFGPTDLTAMYNKPWHNMIPFALQTLTGTTPKAGKEIYEQSSPAHFVTAQTPPTLILHGGNDPVVNISQSKLLKAKLEKAGVRHELVVYPRERHGWFGSTLSNSFDRIIKFLEEQPN
ncbi:alpha/beta hydrolase [Chitinophagaceae bacterium LB-8]|uniref:Alpha/beta hydrolase n=1 Tax=Paraflavisolibacter caeni TaxID=2982496 RepID=A0A9X2XNQ4_9BACT|nr:alpha/beta hydrolase [Paraflavisolibacter caeni]MCU7549343.1 alpha/beta hydrolase [Paraflavisolibacter caeni]